MSNGYVLQHRLVMECVLGRLLEPGELVHHRNEVKNDNRPENLTLMSHSEHATEHSNGTLCQIPLTEQQVRAALDGRTTLQAAQHLGVSHAVLYDRFDHLLRKRRSPGAPLPEAELAQLAILAADPDENYYSAGEKMGHSHSWVATHARRAGLAWVHRKGRKVGATDLRTRERRGTGSLKQKRRMGLSS